ncbi:uncharacterized protein LOC131682856 isoform X4 [Topomyia yanbarensis]|uniref:uncharacterized protein LOC131682856 isoform X4 n=1 Tax=Topomyia yanbarensis TaxID=2498891 RepID=UPI00273C0C26|nr:uncharacterized protein LOC131682856 isoform X4 [Topomyia yanbarensis]
MKCKCSVCGVWMLSTRIRKLTNKLYDCAMKKKKKTDESNSFICFRCYNKLYEPNDPETEEAVAGPSRIAVPESLETLTAIAGPSGLVSFSYQETFETLTAIAGPSGFVSFSYQDPLGKFILEELENFIRVERYMMSEGRFRKRFNSSRR